jgi:hypothetical protein
MNTLITLRRNHRSHAPSLWSWRSLQWLALAVVVAWVLHMFMQPAQVDGGASDTQATPAVSTVVHWKDADHDWLLVADQATHELVVYDANSGQPLRRVGVANGAGPIDSIVGEGPWLITTSQGGQHLQVLSLPGLQPAMLATR